MLKESPARGTRSYYIAKESFLQLPLGTGMERLIYHPGTGAVRARRCGSVGRFPRLFTPTGHILPRTQTDDRLVG